MPPNRKIFRTLTFTGARFDDHGLDVDALTEVRAYKTLVLETARAVWRRRNPDRERLPKGFLESFSLKFYSIEPGSTSIPLERSTVGPAANSTAESDEFDESAQIINDVIEAMTGNLPFPNSFPGSVAPYFEPLGKGFRKGEAIVISGGPSSARAVRYTSEVRDRIANWSKKSYEDTIDLIGEVRSADIDGSRFRLKLRDGRKIEGRFDGEDQRRTITKALDESGNQSLRVKGRASFFHGTGAMREIVRVDSIEAVPIDGPAFDPTEKPFWQAIVEIGQQVPIEEWEKLPRNLSERINEELYGSGGG